MTRTELITFICDIFNIKDCPELIQKQINKYVTEHGYNYLDIARALSYFVDVQGNEPQLKYGIGIVPLVIKDARKYFQKLKEEKEAQIRMAQKIKEKNETGKVIYVRIKNNKSIHKPMIDINKL